MNRHLFDIESESIEEKQQQQERYDLMTKTPVRPLVIKMAIPAIISMVITALYNIIDTMYVGRLSTEATAGIGVSFAYMALIQALGFFFGHGSGNFISQCLGAKKHKDAETMAAVGFFSPLILGSIIGMTGLAILPHLSKAIGATPDILKHTNDYLRFILIATPFMMSSLTLNNQLRLQGNAQYAMVGIAIGAIINIIIDPIFIFVFDMGVSGASLATAISQFISWTALLKGTRRKGNVHIRIKNFKPSLHQYQLIFEGGFPSLCRQILASISITLLNHAAAIYAVPGYEASTLAAFAVVTRIMMFIFSIILGIGQGFQPICGFNYGARLYERVRSSYIFTIKVMTVILIIMAVSLSIFAPQIISLFRNEDAELIKIGTYVMLWQCLALPLSGLNTATNMLFQTIRMTFKATLLSICRQGLFFIPTILIAPLFLGLQGVEITQAVADALSFMLTVPFSIWIIKDLKKKEAQNNLSASKA